MDLARLKKLMRESGGKFIIIEGGEPELVVLPFSEYERLIGQRGNPEENVRKEYYNEGPSYQESRAPSREFDVAPMTLGESIGLPVRLEDIRVEDLPI